MAHELRSLDQILGSIVSEDGETLLDLVLAENAETIRKLRDHSRAYGGTPKGSVTLTLNYGLNRKGEVAASGKIATKTPNAPAASATLWSNAEGDLSPVNPDQMRFELRDATPEDREIRSV